tara:strand:+ start:701 stop:1012 length:312 start_codon:yes stop_codon:yes gene_type:complete
LKKDNDFYQDDMPQNIGFLSLGPFISIVLSIIFIVSGIQAFLFTSAVITSVIILFLISQAALIILTIGPNVVIEMKADLFSTIFLGLSILMPLCIISHIAFTN